jgi:hypothetical protein
LLHSVSAVRRLAEPRERWLKISADVCTMTSSSPLTATPPFPSSMRLRPLDALARGSGIPSSIGASRQGLTLVHFSAQPQPCLPQNFTIYTP